MTYTKFQAISLQTFEYAAIQNDTALSTSIANFSAAFYQVNDKKHYF